MSGFHGAFATGVASQQGTLTLPDTWFRPPFWDLLMLQLLRPNSSNLPCLYSTFHLEYPLVLSRFCLKCIENFGQFFGLRTNFTKTQAVWIGGKRGCGEEIETEENIDWNHNGKFKLLGIYYDVNKNDPSTENYELKLKEIRNSRTGLYETYHL